MTSINRDIQQINLSNPDTISHSWSPSKFVVINNAFYKSKALCIIIKDTEAHYWIMDLKSIYEIYSVIFKSDYLFEMEDEGFELRTGLYDFGGNNRVCQRLPSKDIKFDCMSIVGRYISIHLTKPYIFKIPIQICDLKVFGGRKKLKNLAYMKHLYYENSHGAIEKKVIVDGKYALLDQLTPSACISLMRSERPILLIDLGYLYLIHLIIVQNTPSILEYENLENVIVGIGYSKNIYEHTDCWQIRNALPGEIVKMWCRSDSGVFVGPSRPIRGQWASLYKNLNEDWSFDEFSLCEIKIYGILIGGKWNIATGKLTYASEISPESVRPLLKYDSGLAVDGLFKPFSTSFCYVSPWTIAPFWTVYLGSLYEVVTVVILNSAAHRKHILEDDKDVDDDNIHLTWLNIKNTAISVHMDKEIGELSYLCNWITRGDAYQGAIIEKTCTSPLQGIYVTLHKGIDQYMLKSQLILCEVEVYGERLLYKDDTYPFLAPLGPNNIYTLQSKIINLTCRVNGNYKLYWLDSLGTKYENIHARRLKYWYDFQKNTTEFVLNIYPAIGEYDYKCCYYNGFCSMKTKIIARNQVYKPVSIKLLYSRANMGTDYHLICRIRGGIPSPSLSFMINERRKECRPDQTPTPWKSLKYRLSHYYTCYANFKPKYNSYHNIKCIVEQGSERLSHSTVMSTNDKDLKMFVYPTLDNKVINIVEGYSYEIRCSINDNNPYWRYSIWKDGRVLSVNIGTDVKYSFVEVSVSEGGDYMCMARSPFNEINNSFVLVVHYIPTINATQLDNFDCLPANFPSAYDVSWYDYRDNLIIKGRRRLNTSLINLKDVKGFYMVCRAVIYLNHGDEHIIQHRLDIKFPLDRVGRYKRDPGDDEPSGDPGIRASNDSAKSGSSSKGEERSGDTNEVLPLFWNLYYHTGTRMTINCTGSKREGQDVKPDIGERGVKYVWAKSRPKEDIEILSQYSGFTFTISSLKLTDKGLYQCEYDKSNILKSAPGGQKPLNIFNVTVYQTPLLSIRHYYEVSDGLANKIECIVNATPKPYETYWMSVETNKKTLTASLPMKQFTPRDNGEWACVSSIKIVKVNVLDTLTLTSKAYTHVLFANKSFKEINMMGSIGRFYGMEEKLDVFLYYNESSAQLNIGGYEWVKNDTSIENKNSVLKLYNVKMDDTGPYQISSMGTPVGRITLIVLYGPIINITSNTGPAIFTNGIQTFEISEMKTLNITANVKSYYKYQVQWSKQGGKKYEENQDLIFQRVTKDDEGIYDCTVTVPEYKLDKVFPPRIRTVYFAIKVKGEGCQPFNFKALTASNLSYDIAVNEFENNVIPYGKIITWSCYGKDVMAGSPVSTCQNNGEWDNFPPYCGCALPKVKFGEAMGANGDLVIICNEGYSFSAEELKCINGAWSDPYLECGKKCHHDGTSDDRVKKTLYMDKELRNEKCDTEAVKNGWRKVKCTSGRWLNFTSCSRGCDNPYKIQGSNEPETSASSSTTSSNRSPNESTTGEFQWERTTKSINGGNRAKGVYHPDANQRTGNRRIPKSLDKCRCQDSLEGFPNYNLSPVTNLSGGQGIQNLKINACLTLEKDGMPLETELLAGSFGYILAKVFCCGENIWNQSLPICRQKMKSRFSDACLNECLDLYIASLALYRNHDKLVKGSLLSGPMSHQFNLLTKTWILHDVYRWRRFKRASKDRVSSVGEASNKSKSDFDMGLNINTRSRLYNDMTNSNAPTSYPVGYKLKIVCPPNTQLVGRNTSICQEDGSWSPGLTCSPCQNVAKIMAEGEILGTSNDARLAINCLGNAKNLKDKDPLCQDLKQSWNGALCSKNCPKPVIVHGNFMVSQGVQSENPQSQEYEDKTKIIISCESDYRPSTQSSQSTCLAGTWRDIPQCVKGCVTEVWQQDQMIDVSTAQQIHHYYPLNYSLTVRCVQAMMISGNPDWICNTEGKWEGHAGCTSDQRKTINITIGVGLLLIITIIVIVCMVIYFKKIRIRPDKGREDSIHSEYGADDNPPPDEQEITEYAPSESDGNFYHYTHFEFVDPRFEKLEQSDLYGTPEMGSYANVEGTMALTKEPSKELSNTNKTIQKSASTGSLPKLKDVGDKTTKAV